jgi:hypothetical protein
LETAKFDKYVFTVIRTFTEKGVYSGQYQVNIRGQHICKALQDFYTDFDGISFEDSSRILSGYPIHDIDDDEVKQVFYARDYLLKLLEDEQALPSPDGEKIFQLEAAKEFIIDKYGEHLRDLQSMGTGRITFWLLWTLFPPHEIIYLKDLLKQSKAARALYTRYTKQQDGTWTFTVVYDYIDSDGTSIGYVNAKTQDITEFQDIAAVDSLNVFPLDLHPDVEALKQRFITRGKKGFGLFGRNIQEYQGLCIGDYDQQLRLWPKLFVGLFHIPFPLKFYCLSLD